MTKQTYIGNGRNKNFYFIFPFFSPNEVLVKINDIVAVEYGLFCNQGVSNQDFPFTGGHVKFTKPPKPTDIITIERNLQYNRVIDYQETAKINPTTLNQDMNYFFESLKDIKSILNEFNEKYAEFTDTESANDLKERINAVTEQIDDFAEQIETIGDITTIQTNISNLSQSVSELTSTIATHTTEITTLQNSLNSIHFIPDYSNGINKTWNTEYTATENGLLVFCAWCNGSGSGIYAIVNGTTLYKTSDNSPMGPGWTGGDHQAYFGGILPIGKGDTYKLCGGSGNQKLTFFPYK